MTENFVDGWFLWVLACVLVGGWTLGGLVARVLAWLLWRKE